MNLSALVIAVMLVSSSALAGKLDGESWNANLNYFMRTTKIDEGKGETTIMDFTAGYARSNGFYLGGIYSTGSGNNTHSHMGASLGYMKNGWNLVAHYLLGGTANLAGTEYKEGTGTQIDVGRVFKTDFPIFVGVQVSSKSMTYKAKASTGSSVKFSDLYPAIKLAYYW